MSSDCLENESAAAVARPSAQRLLLLLKSRGPQTASDLGGALGITGEAARQQLAKLAQEGLVQAASESRGVGRPSQVWTITAKGNARFPDTHAELTVQLIEAVRTTLGDRALEQLIAARERKMRETYRQALRGATRLKTRIARLVALRNREGYMADCQSSGDDFLLVENHCPICAAAAACTGFCRSELELFRAVLGKDVEVTRVEHLIDGARRCVYRISRRKPN
jgi:predicted ArsR family transcriptional regulator